MLKLHKKKIIDLQIFFVNCEKIQQKITVSLFIYLCQATSLTGSRSDSKSKMYVLSGLINLSSLHGNCTLNLRGTE